MIAGQTLTFTVALTLCAELNRPLSLAGSIQRTSLVAGFVEATMIAAGFTLGLTKSLQAMIATMTK